MSNENSAFTRNALDLLSRRLEDASAPEDFLREVDALRADPQNRLVLRDGIELAEPLSVGDEPRNARLLYEALGAMDRANASDPRMWSYLALVTFRDYMLERWPLETAGDWKSRVKTRWLMSRANRENLVRHGIARLWWVANLTFDGQLSHRLSVHEEDPYAYTTWVLQREDRVQAIFEREVGSSSIVLVSLMDVLASVETQAHGQLVKRFMKEVTAASAYRDLDVLDGPTLTSVLTGLLPDELALDE